MAIGGGGGGAAGCQLISEPRLGLGCGSLGFFVVIVLSRRVCLLRCVLECVDVVLCVGSRPCGEL